MVVIVKDCDPAVFVKFNDAGETDKVGACYVTVTILSGTPVALKVMVAVRWEAPVCSVTEKVTLAFPVPEAGDTVAQLWLLLAVQFVLEASDFFIFPA